MTEGFVPPPPTAPIEGLETDRLDVLRDIDEGDTAYIHRAIGNFQVNSVQAVATIRAALEEQDAASVRAISHKIAGSAFNLGVPEAGNAARAVEMAAEEGDLARAASLLPGLETSMARSRELLLVYRDTLGD